MTPLLTHLVTAATAALVGTWPLNPHTVVRGFEPPSTAYSAGHRGVDLAGTTGEVVHTGLGGRVTFVGQVGGTPTVVVTHRAVRTTYQPVRASVAVGQRVKTGAAIGTLGASHSHCAPKACLHWGYLRGQSYLNPLSLVERVRLLP